MPLSEHEQRMLDQIERALYEEDPKFATTVSKSSLSRPHRKRRWRGAALFVVGLAGLLGGILLPVRVLDVPVISVVGFLLMFSGAILMLTTIGAKSEEETAEQGGDGNSADSTGGHGTGSGTSKSAKSGSGTSASGKSGSGKGGKRDKSGSEPQRASFAQRMEDRLRRRFDDR